MKFNESEFESVMASVREQVPHLPPDSPVPDTYLRLLRLIEWKSRDIRCEAWDDTAEAWRAVDRLARAHQIALAAVIVASLIAGAIIGGLGGLIVWILKG